MNTTKTKDFRLFKRLDQTHPDYPAASYYFKFEYRGTAYTRKLETNLVAEAQRRARLRFKEITEAIQREDYPTLERTKLRATTTAKISALLAAYQTAPVDAKAQTRTTNINALKQLLRLGTNITEPTVTNPASAGSTGLGSGSTGPASGSGSTGPESGSITLINSDLARSWFTAKTAEAQAEPDQAKAASLKRSANSRFIQAASLFTPRALDTYQAAGCWHRHFEDFVKIGLMLRFTRVNNPQYNPPGDETIRATLADWEKLTDRDLFLAIGHELAFGLRKQEMAQARWSWWTVREGYPVLDGRANVKSGTGLVQVRALDPWYNIMRARILVEGWHPALGTNLADPTVTNPATAEDLIIQGTETYRTDDLFRKVSEFLRAHGWETQKTNHALRAYAGSQVAMRYTIYEAQTWLRHSTVTVTEQNYSHFIRKFRPANLETLPAKWATAAPQPPILRIVQSA